MTISELSDDVMKAKLYHVNDFGPYNVQFTHGDALLLMDGNDRLDVSELRTFLNALYITTGGKRYFEAFDSLVEESQADKKQIADLRHQLDQAKRREGLLRPLVVEWVYDEYGQFCIHCNAMKLDSVDSHEPDCPYKAAIDDGALEGGG